ncbi:major facilitator superfamily domain-containing protein [Ditylenchus destructor]|nr:major facilitator superfamily domain-containing protein [Ditylenchus destructor]
MNLFTEAGERARAMGVYGFVCAGGGSIGVLLGGLLTSALSWHWIFLVNLPIGALVLALCLWLIERGGPTAPGETLEGAGAVTVTASLMLAVYAVVNGNEAGWTSTRTLAMLGGGGAAARRLPGAGDEGRASADAAVAVPAALGGGVQRDRRAVGGGHVCLVFRIGAVHAAGAALRRHAGGPGVSAGQPDHGGLFTGAVGQAGDALWHPRAADHGPVAGGAGAGAVCPRARRRRLLAGRAARGAAAGPGRRRGLLNRCCWRR